MADAEGLGHSPLVDLAFAPTAFHPWVCLHERLGFFAQSDVENPDADALGGWTRKEDFACLVLSLHPGEIFRLSSGDRFARNSSLSHDDVPHWCSLLASMLIVLRHP